MVDLARRPPPSPHTSCKKAVWRERRPLKHLSHIEESQSRPGRRNGPRPMLAVAWGKKKNRKTQQTYLVFFFFFMFFSSLFSNFLALCVFNEISSFAALKLDLLVPTAHFQDGLLSFCWSINGCDASKRAIEKMSSKDAFVHTCLGAARVCVSTIRIKPGAREMFSCLLYFGNCF